MTIPKKFQLFDEPVELSDKDAERLSCYLSGWMSLHAFLLQGINDADIRRLVVIELMGMRRRSILDRLLSRLTTNSRKKVQTKLEAALR
jgi:hypothetical protein